jgi:integrase
MAILLFCSCKRRKEITSLQIEDVNFSGHYICYTEYKNSSRLKCIRKAFYLTPAMELFLKRIIGDRKSGSLWPDNHHPDFFSHAFEEIASKVVPHKHSTLKDMRQVATDVMEKAGLSDNEIDITLGHLSVSKALQYYQDRSPDAIARRLSVRTKPGIEVLSAAIAEYLK